MVGDVDVESCFVAAQVGDVVAGSASSPEKFRRQTEHSLGASTLDERHIAIRSRSTYLNAGARILR